MNLKMAVRSCVGIFALIPLSLLFILLSGSLSSSPSVSSTTRTFRLKEIRDARQDEYARGKFIPSRFFEDFKNKNDLVPRKLCPKTMANCVDNGEKPHFCGRQYNLKNVMEYVPHCCRLLNGTEFARKIWPALGRRVLILIGDSLMLQQFISLSCILETRSEDSFNVEKLSDNKYILSGGMSAVFFFFSKFLLQPKELRGRNGRGTKMFDNAHDDGWIDVLLQARNTTGKEPIVVMNTGAWYSQHVWGNHLAWKNRSSAQITDIMMKNIRSALNLLSAVNYTGPLIWRSLNSFSTLTSAYDFTRFSYGEFQSRNDKVRQLLQVPEYKNLHPVYFDVYNIARDDAHPSFYKNTSQYVDNLHFCSPGLNAIPNIWNYLTLHAILNLQ